MADTRKSDDIGLRQGYRLCNMSADKRLKFIAEGLPIILESARSLMKASRALKDFPREAELLERQAEEESAKILILIDVIRCPPKILASRMGDMMKWFYDHLARLIYAKAQSWKPTNVAMLQEYVDTSRQSHYLEGEYSEYIMPNWELFCREIALYADVMCDEDADPTWCSPLQTVAPELFAHLDPISYVLVEGLEAAGAFTEAGLRIMRDVWGRVDFNKEQEWSPTRELFNEMAEKLDAAGLVNEDRLTEDHVRNLRNNWQLPMYHIDFSAISVPLEKLRGRRENDTPYF